MFMEKKGNFALFHPYNVAKYKEQSVYLKCATVVTLMN
jgi:hypothetical protein